MKKRMTILALLLAGAVTLGSYGMVQAGQETVRCRWRA